MDEQALLAHKCFSYGVFTKCFLINHPSSNIGSIANLAVTKGETVFFFHEALKYKNMYAYGSRQYGEDVMEVSCSAFGEFAIQLKAKVRCSDLCDHTSWIVPAKFNSFWFVNDSRSIPGEPSPPGASSLQ